MHLRRYLRKIRNDWDARARLNGRHFIADGREHWTEEEFYASGRQTVAEDILADMGNICQGRDPKTMRVLELGGGAGRVTRALAEVFGEVHAVDASVEMVRQARAALLHSPNAFIYQIDGLILNLPDRLRFDFAYSCCVFHQSPVTKSSEGLSGKRQGSWYPERSSSLKCRAAPT